MLTVVIRRSRTYSGEVWTDASGRATIELPQEVDLVAAAVSYGLRPAGGVPARVVSASSDGRVSIETNEPHVRVAWHLRARRPARASKGGTTDE